MKNIFFLLFIGFSFIVQAQDTKPDTVTFKTLQTYSVAYNSADSALWVYKGRTYSKPWFKIQHFSKSGAFKGDTNYVAKFYGNKLINSLIYSDSTGVGIGTKTPNNLFEVKRFISSDTTLYNTFFGNYALDSITSGGSNFAIGYASLFSNKTGSNNVAIGTRALYNNNANNNTALGDNALAENTTGASNIAIGEGALSNLLSGSRNVSIGSLIPNVVTGDNNVIIGVGSTTGSESSNQIVIGSQTPGNGSNTATIGNNDIIATYLKGHIYADSAMTALEFIPLSDRKLKQNIKNLRKSDFLKSSKIQFHKFNFISTPNQLRYGVIAQEVEQVAPELVRTDKNGTKSVNYTDLLILKISELEERIRKLESK